MCIPATNRGSKGREDDAQKNSRNNRMVTVWYLCEKKSKTPLMHIKEELNVYSSRACASGKDSKDVNHWDARNERGDTQITDSERYLKQ